MECILKYLCFRERREAEQRERERQEKERQELERRERLEREQRAERDRREREHAAKQLSAVEAVDHHFQLSMELAKKVFMTGSSTSLNVKRRAFQGDLTLTL